MTYKGGFEFIDFLKTQIFFIRRNLLEMLDFVSYIRLVFPLNEVFFTKRSNNVYRSNACIPTTSRV